MHPVDTCWTCISKFRENRTEFQNLQNIFLQKKKKATKKIKKKSNKKISFWIQVLSRRDAKDGCEREEESLRSDRMQRWKKKGWQDAKMEEKRMTGWNDQVVAKVLVKKILSLSFFFLSFSLSLFFFLSLSLCFSLSFSFHFSPIFESITFSIQWKETVGIEEKRRNTFSNWINQTTGMNQRDRN